VAPVTPKPPPPGPRPNHPPEPARGKCSSLQPGISLLGGSGLGPPDFSMIGKLETATACEAACLAQPCCSGETQNLKPQNLNSRADSMLLQPCMQVSLGMTNIKRNGPTTATLSRIPLPSGRAQ
jgi:hypothetical protein